jgi:hypothetical protein
MIASRAVMLTDGHTSMNEINAVGTFTFDDVIPGIYQLEVTLGDDCIPAEGFAIGQ